MADSAYTSEAGTGAASSPKDSDDSAAREKVKQEFLTRFKTSKKHWQDWREEAKELFELIAGRQWSQIDLDKLDEQERPHVTFNLSGKYMDAITGLQINNRQDIRYFPRELGDAKPNELLTGAVSWCRDQCQMIDEETDAFYDATLTGMGWMEGFLDRDIDPRGVAAGRRVDPLEMLPDPAARQRNLVDARYVIRERLMDHDEYKELFGDYADDVGDDGIITEDRTPDVDEETGLQVIPSPHDYGDSSGSVGEKQTKGKCPVQDYQFWTREKCVVIEAQGLPRRELTTEEYAAEKPNIDMVLSQGIKIDVNEIMKKVYYRAYFSGGKMGPYGRSPYQKGFTYQPITGKRDRNKMTWYGLGRAMVDSQRWTNKFFSTILYSLMTNAKGGIMAEENAFKDARKAEEEWANPSSITWLKSGSLSGDKPRVMPKPEARYPTGLDRLMEFSMQSFPETTGLNAEILGLVNREQAGVVEQQRKQSAMAVIAWAFDAMRRYYRSMGQLMATYVIEYMPDGMLVKISGQGQAQFVPLLKSQLAVEFDTIVDEAPTSTNMKERVWAVVESLVPPLLKAGYAPPKEVLDYSPLPEDLIQAWKKSLEPTPEMQKAKQAEVEQKIADVEATKAKAAKDNADAQATLTEINAPQAQGQSDAMLKANADIQIAQMEAAVEQRLEELKANKKAETDLLIARMKLHSEAQKAKLQGIIDLKLGEMQADTAVQVAKSKPKPKPASKAN